MKKDPIRHPILIPPQNLSSAELARLSSSRLPVLRRTRRQSSTPGSGESLGVQSEIIHFRAIPMDEVREETRGVQACRLLMYENH